MQMTFSPRRGDSPVAEIPPPIQSPTNTNVISAHRFTTPLRPLRDRNYDVPPFPAVSLRSTAG